MFDAHDLSISAMVGSPLDNRIDLLTLARCLEPIAATAALEAMASADPRRACASLRATRSRIAS